MQWQKKISLLLLCTASSHPHSSLSPHFSNQSSHLQGHGYLYHVSEQTRIGGQSLPARRVALRGCLPHAELHRRGLVHLQVPACTGPTATPTTCTTPCTSSADAAGARRSRRVAFGVAATGHAPADAEAAVAVLSRGVARARGSGHVARPDVPARAAAADAVLRAVALALAAVAPGVVAARPAGGRAAGA